MLDRIEAWRKKPTPVKQQYALTAAVLATLVVVGIWATTLPTRLAVFDFSNDELIVAEKPAPEPGIVLPEAPSRFSSFTASVADGFARLRDRFESEAPAAPVVAEPATTSTPWTEAVAAMQQPASTAAAKPIMIEVATTTAAVDTSTSTATTSEAVLQ